MAETLMKGMRLVGLVVLTGLFAGCAEDVHQASFSQRDSVGITIVESVSPKWSEAEGWFVDSVPFLDLTTSGTGAPHWFYRVSDAIRRSDGSIVVAENDSDEIRFFSPEGAFIRAVGGEGEGPGEFRWPHGIDRYRGDSLIVFDPELGRVTVLGLDGDVARVVPVRLEAARLWHLHPLDDSTFVARAPLLWVPGEPDGLYRRPEALVRLSDSGNLMDTVAIIAGSEEFQWNSGGISSIPLFVRDSRFAVYKGQVYLGDADEMEFKAYSAQGVVERIIRAPSFDLSVSREEIQAERDARLGQNPSERNRGLMEAMPDPETRPAYTDLVIDSEGFIWAEESKGRTLTMTDGRPSRWTVFSPEGEWLGRVQIPYRFFVFEIGPDYVLGRRHDDEDVEHVELLRLTRTNAGGR